MTRIVLTGGAGFVGSHVADALIARGDTVICIDNLTSGRRANIEHLVDHERFTFMEADIRHAPTVTGDVDVVLHLASPASPAFYLTAPILTLETGSIGTQWCLDLARDHHARFLLASTSEVYGDPAQHPQTEDYWGNVNPVGERSVYDEAKRFGEALTAAYRRHHGVNTAIIRIFNTYGPRMHADDGRVVSTFVSQALAGEPLTVFGDGTQTRSFCYVSDLVAGILTMADSDEAGPINLGNDAECSIRELAEIVLRHTGSDAAVSFGPLPVDDPTRRRPDISAAARRLGWAPSVPLEQGLTETVDWFAHEHRHGKNGQ